MKRFFKEKAVILILIAMMISIFVVGNVYFNNILYVEEETTTVPTTTVDINIDYGSVTNIAIAYNLDLDSLGAKSYIVSFEYESENYQAYLDKDYFLVEMIVGEEPEAQVMALIREHIMDENLIEDKAYFVSYDSTTKTIEMETVGFVGSPIQVTIVLNDNLDGVSSFDVSSPENYDSEYNQRYSGGSAPEVENIMIQDYIDNGLPVDSVAGASMGTGPAMQELLTLLDLLLNSLQGGN